MSNTQDSKWNKETKSGTYSDKVHHGEMRKGWDKDPVLSGKSKELPKEIAEIINQESKDKYPVVEKVGHGFIQSDHRKKDRQRQDYRSGATAWAQIVIGFAEMIEDIKSEVSYQGEGLWMFRGKRMTTEDLLIEYLNTLPQ